MCDQSCLHLALITSVFSDGLSNKICGTFFRQSCLANGCEYYLNLDSLVHLENTKVCYRLFYLNNAHEVCTFLYDLNGDLHTEYANEVENNTYCLIASLEKARLTNKYVSLISKVYRSSLCQARGTVSPVLVVQLTMEFLGSSRESVPVAPAWLP